MQEIFESTTRPSGDFAGVFEYDGAVGYFYLYELGGHEAGERIAGALHVVSGEVDFGRAAVQVAWSRDEQTVGLLIHGVMWAVFDVTTGTGHSDTYRAGVKPVSG